MRLSSLFVAAASLAAVQANVDIDVTHSVKCIRKTERMDSVYMHYRGRLQATGEEFDASYNRGQPFRFTLGVHQVIKGWDEGLLDMCVGEKRTLTISPEYGYGDSGIGPIPGGATLIFDTELMGIHGHDHEAEQEGLAEEGAPVADSKDTEDATNVGEKVASVISGAAEVAKTVLIDSDDAQEHEEL